MFNLKLNFRVESEPASESDSELESAIIGLAGPGPTT